MSRLPDVFSDGNAWGTILNDFLSQAHNADGSIKNLYANVRDPVYGAKGDGTTDDTTAIQTAINSLTAGGIVYFPPGTYMISAALTLPADGITLKGTGTDVNGVNGTVLKKSTNCDLLDASGSATGIPTHRRGCKLHNLTLHGNNLTGKLLRVYYCDEMIMDSVYFYANNDMAVESAEFWDSYFVNCVWQFCGDTGATNPSVYLKNSVASSGFGFSNDTTNMIWFVNCHWEQFYAGALWIDVGVSNTAPPNGIYLVNCKMETTFCTGQAFLSASAYCANVTVTNLYLSGDAFYAGHSTPGTAIIWYTGSGSVLQNVFANANAAVFSSIIDIWTSNPFALTLRNITQSGTNPTVAILTLHGGSTPLYMENISGQSGAVLVNGAAPIIMSKQNKVHVPAYAASYTPDPLNKGNTVIISPVTGALTFNAPAFQWAGADLHFLLTSNATGLYALTWNAAFKATQTALPTAMPGPNLTLSVKFVSDGTNWYRVE